MLSIRNIFARPQHQLHIALFYVHNDNTPQTVKDNLQSFKEFSNHAWHYLPYNLKKPRLPNKNNLDCIVIHYYGQVYMDFPDYLVKYLQDFTGLKIIFAQDEYDLLENNRTKYLRVKPDILFSACSINQRIQELLYPFAMFPNMRIINYLTGYVPYQNIEQVLPIKERSLPIFYRGNSLGVAYGKLGYEKMEIGQKMREFCNRKGIAHDIEVHINKQIYKDEYLTRMKSARCTLITESGSGIIDYHIETRRQIINEINNDLSLPFEHFVAKYPDFYKDDMKYLINTISPKAFEAIACKTALIGYEGEYSGILQSDIHYIVLKRDWSNIEEVLSKIKDVDLLQALVDRAYADIVESKKYSYESFIKKFDQTITEECRVKKNAQIGVVS